MRFLVHYEARDGCSDSTVIDSSSTADFSGVVWRVIDGLLGNQIGDYDQGLEWYENITVYEFTQKHTIDLDAVRQKAQARQAAKKEKAQDKADRATYEKLKARYGSGEAINEV